MRWIVAAISGMALAGPVAAETLQLDGVFAARAREASLLPTIAVGEIAGIDGAELGLAIEQRLAKVEGADVPHAQLIAPVLRPDGLLTGRLGLNVSDIPYTEGRDRCVEKQKDKCVRRVKYRVACLRRSVDLRADLKLERRRDGRILYADAKTRSDFDTGCEDIGIVGSVDSMARGMIESIAQEVRLDLAAHRDRYTVRVQEDRKGLPPEAATRFRQAVRLTKTDPGAACRTFAEVDAMAPDHGPTLFNMALCDEQAGRYAEAGDRYLRARVFAPGAGGDVSKGLGRVAQLAAGVEDRRQMAALTASAGMRGPAASPR